MGVCDDALYKSIVSNQRGAGVSKTSGVLVLTTSKDNRVESIQTVIIQNGVRRSDITAEIRDDVDAGAD